MSQINDVLMLYPIGVQNFEDLRKNGYVYVDKTAGKVVVLVDEYDKPLLQTIGNTELQNTCRNILKAFTESSKVAEDRFGSPS